MADAIKVVREFCNVMVERDAEALRPFLAEDSVYQNVGQPPILGTAAIVDNLAAQFSAFPDSYEYQVLNIAAHDNIVLTERLDMIRTPAGQLHGVPVMGAFEVRNDRISRWTDYWDSALVAKMLSGQDVSTLIPTGA